MKTTIQVSVEFERQLYEVSPESEELSRLLGEPLAVIFNNLVEDVLGSFILEWHEEDDSHESFMYLRQTSSDEDFIDFVIEEDCQNLELCEWLLRFGETIGYRLIFEDIGRL